MEKRRLIIILIFVIILNLVFSLSLIGGRGVSAFSVFIYRFFSFQSAVTSLGQVMLNIMSEWNIDIIQPESLPVFYTNRTVGLNVSATIPLNQLSWWFELYKNKTGVLIYSASFIPNTTISAVKGLNNLIVFANNGSTTKSKSVVFNVSVENYAPILQNISNLFVCEDKALSFFFRANDTDYDPLTFSLSPSNPFFVRFDRFDRSASIGEIYSGLLGKQNAFYNGMNWRDYPETLWAYDDDNFIDLRRFNITVIGVNHAPFFNLPNVMTVMINESFYYQADVSDLEDGNASGGNLLFNLSFVSGAQFFEINETYGFINITPNDSHRGNYEIEICAKDRGLINAHLNLTDACGVGNESLFSCSLMELTVTIFNRPPNITYWWNSKTNRELNLTIQELESVLFNVSAYDPDGTIPEIIWYLDNRSVRDIINNTDSYFYATIIGDAGLHFLVAKATDGLLNDSVQWNITVLPTFVNPPAGGGGGASAGGVCIEKWGCNEWSTCQNAGLVSQSEDIFYSCSLERIAKEYCGFQLRKCFDVNACKTTKKRPNEIQSCYYVEKPGCYDNVKNCHEGDCEILIDCGGPCADCPTCSDRSKNQGEFGIDCGGPCPFECPEIAIPREFPIWIVWLAFLLILIMVIVVLFVIWRIHKMRESYRYNVKKLVGK